MVRILPESQASEDGVTAINHTVAVAAIRGLVISGQREKAVLLLSRWRVGLRREITEHFRAIIYCTVAVSVQSQPRIVCASSSPREFVSSPVIVEVERNSTSYIRHGKAIARRVNEDRRAAADVAAGAGACVKVVVAAVHVAFIDESRATRPAGSAALSETVGRSSGRAATIRARGGATTCTTYSAVTIITTFISLDYSNISACVSPRDTTPESS